VGSTGNSRRRRKLYGWGAIEFFAATIVGPFVGVPWWICAAWVLGGLYATDKSRKLGGHAG
jgi:hypothetical protein